MRGRWSGITGALVVLAGLAGWSGVVAAPVPVVLREALVIESLGRGGRNTLFTDALEAELVAGRWQPPQSGQEVRRARDGASRFWTNATANAEGWFAGRELRGGWAYIRHEAPEAGVMLLNASGHSMAYVNGEPRAGDVYGYGYVSVPVLLRAGVNHLLFAGGRGRLRVQMARPPAPVFWQASDLTVPDVMVGEDVDTWAAAVLVNATPEWVRGARVLVELGGTTTETEVGVVPPLGVRKVGFRLRSPSLKEGGTTSATVVLRLGGVGEVGEPLRLDLRVRRSEEVHKRTFVSAIDGSVQYYAVNPGPQALEGGCGALFLSLHGASVEALGQAEAYGRKWWGTLVAPTNRRPYGFDWEEWGRMDALEVLNLARARFRPDLDRVYLTGHSMGGHGTWNFGVTFPDRFAAIGPSAGWISFFSYAGTDPFTNATPVEGILRRAAASSDTLAMATNYLHHGVYIVHGDADDNVPVREARRMREVLGTFHRDFAWHEQPGAGHWWGNSDEPGSECVDWPPMFDFFARHRIPGGTESRRVRFVTVNPGVSAGSQWVTVEAQEKLMVPSEVDAQWDPGLRRIVATTRNTERLGLEVGAFGAAPDGYQVVLDGKRFDGLQPGVDGGVVGSGMSGSGEGRGRTQWLRFDRSSGEWRVAVAASKAWKGPHRAGPFKDAFRHRMVFVHGTCGTREENAWALAKARFDAESFWYRGNGSVEMVADVDFEPGRYADRGVILYGHADMNAAWGRLLGSSPVRVGRGEVRVGGRLVQGDDLACLFLRPRPDSEVACVGVVAGSGMPGLRLTQRLPYFMAGTGYPDCLVMDSEVLEKGTAGIVAAGFFGNDWSVDRGEFAWGAE